LVGLTSLLTREPPVSPKFNRRRALFVLGKIDEILAWERQRERERDTKFVELGRYLCAVRAGQYWRVENLASFDDFLERRFPESRRKAYYLMSIHVHLPPQEVSPRLMGKKLRVPLAMSVNRLVPSGGCFPRCALPSPEDCSGAAVVPTEVETPEASPLVAEQVPTMRSWRPSICPSRVSKRDLQPPSCRSSDLLMNRSRLRSTPISTDRPWERKNSWKGPEKKGSRECAPPLPWRPGTHRPHADPVADRFVHLDCEVDSQEWSEWANRRWHSAGGYLLSFAYDRNR